MTSRQRWALLIATLGVTVYLAMTGEGGHDETATVVEAADRATTAEARNTRASETRILALQQRTESPETKALFAATSWVPPPVKPGPAPPPPPPAAPPLPFRFLGKQWNGQLWEVFVSRGDQTLVLQEKQTVEATYRVESIKPPQMVLTYMPLNEQQTMNIGATE